MAALNAEGIILRKYYLRETSYILVVFTREFGKIKGVMKGVRNPYPQFAGNFEIFTQCRLLFYRKKKRFMDLITQCETLDFFLPLRKDIERLTYANYFIELVNMVTGEHDAQEGLYRTLLESLRMLGTASSAKRISRIFELKFLNEIGLSPQMEKCIACGASVEEKATFSAVSGGMLCGKCARRDEAGLPVSLGTVKFIRRIQRSDLAKTLQIKVSKEVGRETEECLKRFLQYHIARPIKSLRFLDEIKRAGVVG